MAVGIRRIGLADRIMVEELLDVFEPGWTDALAPTASGPLAFLTDGDAFLFGAYDDHDPAGWLWGSHLRRPDGRVMTYVHQIEVHRDHRRRGIATLLMEQALGEARQRRAHKLWLVTARTNGGGNGLYQRLGGSTDPDGEQVYVWNL